MLKGVKNRILSSTKKDKKEDEQTTTSPKSPTTSSSHVTFNSEQESSPPGSPSSPDKKVSQEDFDLLMVIGRGTFGKVMQVRKKDSGEIFAMKVIRKDFVIQHEQIIHTKAEKSIMQRVNHPFIVSLRYAFQTGDKLYMILDYVNGGELFYHLRNSGNFPEARVRLYIAEIALAIDYLHQQGVMYRDLKPENVLVDNDGHIRLTDFGLSKELENRDRKHRNSVAIGLKSDSASETLNPLLTATHISSSNNNSNNSNNSNNNNNNNTSSNSTTSKESGSDRAHTFCGTPDYLAPEILTAVPKDGKNETDESQFGYGKEVDWWAVGILMYEMLVGEPPFYNENTNIMYKRIIKEDVQFPNGMTTNAASLIKGLLHKIPQHRFDGAKLMSHVFFKDLDWKLVYEKKITPLWKPRIAHATDGSQVPDEFKDERAIDSVVDSTMSATMKNKAVEEFVGFTYEGDHAMKQRQRVASRHDEDDVPIEGYLAK